MELLNKTTFLFAPITGRLKFPGHSLTLIIKGTFDLVANGKVKEAEEPLYPTGDEFYSDDADMLGAPRYESDFAYFKPRADLLLSGKCFNPDGKYLKASQVTFQVGSKSKRLAVFGDRRWKRSALGLGSLSETEPFNEMELRYDNSFGGEGFKQNPCGKGYNKEEDESGKKLKKLPNIEDPNNLITSPGSKQDPAGFGPLNRMWKHRHSIMGTYKGDYLKKRWPWFPEDFDYAHFNAAPQDMQVEGYLRGDEKLYFENMHPEHSKYHSQLPGLRVRCFVTKLNKPDCEETCFNEVSMKLDTLWADMEAEKVILVWRGWTDVLSEEYEEIQHIFIMSEELKDQPQNKEQCHALFLKALEEYEAEWAEAPEEEVPETEEEPEPPKAPKVKEPELKPPAKTPIAPEMSKAELTKHISTQSAAIMAQLGISMENLPLEVRQQVEEQQQKIIDKITEEDPSKLMAMEQEENEKKLREELDKIGVDYDNLSPLSDKAKSEQQKILQEMGFKPEEMEENEAITKSWQLMAAVLPKMGIDPENLDSLIDQARPQLEKMKEQLGLEESAEDEEEKAEEEPTAKSQQQDAEDTEGEGEEGEETEEDFSPEKLKARMESGESLEGLDLSNKDFSGKEFKEMDFSGAILVGIVFTGANLEGAVFDKSDFKKADLSGANLAGANLAGADLSNANLEKANLEGADLTECILTGANLKEAQLKEAMFEKAILTKAILDKVDANGTIFTEADLSGASCKQADFSSADLSKCLLNNTVFQNCNMSEASVEGAQGKNVNFIKADLTKFRASEQCNFTQGNFSRISGLESIWQKAILDGANFSYANMEGADFTKASLEKALLSGSNMKFSRFSKANLKDAKMILMNLFQGSLEKADLSGADLTESNMYGAEFLDAITERTNFQGANLKKTKLAEEKY